MLATVLLTTCVLVGQADAADEDLARRVRRLVRGLDDDTQQVRTQSEAGLLKLGPKIIGLLPKITKRTDPNTKAALGRIRQKLELEYARAAAQPSLVTLKADAMPLADVLAAISKQTGNKLVDGRDRDERSSPKITVSLDKTPFWQALDEVLDQAKLTVDHFGAGTDAIIGQEVEPVLLLVDRLEGQISRKKRVAYAGAFRFAARSLQAARNLRAQDAGMMTLTVDVAWEPRVAPIALRHATDKLKVVDDLGKPIAAADEEISQQTPIDLGTTATEMQFPLSLPSRNAKSIARFGASLSALIPGRMTSFQFETLEELRSVEKQRGGVTIVFDHARKNNELWEIRTRIIFAEHAEDLESHLGWIYRSTASLIGPDGKPIEEATSEQYQTRRGIGSSYYFDIAGGLKGHTFVYKTPATLLKMPIEFELKDLPLP